MQYLEADTEGVISRPAFFRQYQRSHPWITFELDLRKAGYSLWLLLGEARSKCDHIAGVPLFPSVAKELNKVYLVKGVHGTTAIEGNTLTEDQVAMEIEGRLEVPAFLEYQRREVMNVENGLHDAVTLVMTQPPGQPLDRERIQRFNATVLDGLNLPDHAIPGEIRKVSVGVQWANYRGAPDEDCEFLLERMCEWLNTMDLQGVLPGLGTAAAGIMRAVLAHLYLAWIHPFGDGNGRTARLLEFYILVDAGLPPLCAHLFSDLYNATRPEYYRQLQYASESGGDVLPFIEYAVGGFVESLRDQLTAIRRQQLRISWRDYVNEQFEDTSSTANLRQRNLVHDLSYEDVPVAKARLTSLSARTAAAYAGKTFKTVTRDVNRLLGMGLVNRESKGFTANKGLVLAFRPLRRPPAEAFVGPPPELFIGGDA